MDVKTYTLSNGVEIPCPGFGTFKAENTEASMSVREALRLGYKHIDGASIYRNEKEVGKGIKESQIAREELFVTSKLWNTERGYESTLKAFHKSLKDLQLEYLDLYLIHWPASHSQFADWESLNHETWRAFGQLYSEGKIKSIGVSNFMQSHLDSLMQFGGIMPMVNQIEVHPGFQQTELVEYCQSLGIVVEAWGPLGQGRLIDHPELIRIGQKYAKSAAQVCLKWSMQKGMLPLVKSVNTDRMKENLEIFDFELSVDDMQIISQLPESGYSGKHPDLITF